MGRFSIGMARGLTGPALLFAAACGESPAAAPLPDAGAASGAASTTARAVPTAAGAARAAPAAAKVPDGRADDFVGRYVYEFGDGANAAGTGVIVSYTLDLTPGSCEFSAQGYQTDEVIACTAMPIARGVDILFKSYGDGGTTDRYGNAVYAVGDPLFALERTGDGVLTRWKGYPLPDDKPHRPGAYFKQAG